MRLTELICWIAAVIVGAALVARAAETPGYPTTGREYCKQNCDYERRMLAGAYRTIGKRDAKWDEPAQKFLEGIAVEYANDGKPKTGRVPGQLSFDDLKKLATAAIDAGCDDPAVLYCYAALLDARTADDAMPMLLKSMEALPHSRYPAIRAFNAAARLQRHAARGGDEEKRLHYLKQASDFALASISVGACEPIDRRFVVESITGWLQGLALAERGDFLQELGKINAEPWMMNVLAGWIDIDLAWEARGIGQANAVTEEGWKGFELKLADAQKCLLKAYELEPKFPEAASHLITVSMALQDQEESTWFDRAVAAQVDYGPAYSKMVYSLYPKWGGSHEAMLAFAEKCASNNRYDTNAPFKALTVMATIAIDLNGDLAIWKSEAGYRIASQVLHRYVEQDQDPDAKKLHLSMLAGLEWLRGDWAASKKALDELGGTPGYEVLSTFSVAPWRVVDEVAACTGPHSAEVIAARTLAANDSAAGRSAFKAIYKNLGRNDPGAHFIYDRIQQLTWMIQFETGEVVHLKPDSSMAGWEEFVNDWKRSKDGSLVTERGKAEGILLCTADFGHRYELMGIVELPPTDANQESYAGVILAWTQFQNSSVMWMRSNSQSVRMSRALDYYTIYPAQVKRESRFRIQVWDGNATARLNDETVFTDEPLWEYALLPNSRIGLASGTAAGGTVKFRELRIRKLTEKPESILDRPKQNKSMRKSATTRAASSP